MRRRSSHSLLWGNFRVWSAALASVRLASPEARQTPTARGARAPWAAPYAPARLVEIGVSSEQGDCRLAPTGISRSTARSCDADSVARAELDPVATHRFARCRMWRVAVPRA